MNNINTIKKAYQTNAVMININAMLSPDKKIFDRDYDKYLIITDKNKKTIINKIKKLLNDDTLIDLTVNVIDTSNNTGEIYTNDVNSEYIKNHNIETIFNFIK